MRPKGGLVGKTYQTHLMNFLFQSYCKEWNVSKTRLTVNCQLQNKFNETSSRLYPSYVSMLLEFVLQIKGQCSIACLYRLVSYYVSGHPGCPGSLFCHFESSPLTRYQFTGGLCGAIKNLQFPKISEYKSHSLRLRRLHIPWVCFWRDLEIRALEFLYIYNETYDTYFMNNEILISFYNRRHGWLVLH